MGSNFGPREVSKLKRPMCTKPYYLQYEAMVFDLPRGSEIEEKSMPKRLQDKSGFQEAKNNEKVSNIGPSWRPKSSQVASKSKLKMQSILSGPKQWGRGQKRKKETRGLGPTGGTPPAQELRIIRLSYGALTRPGPSGPANFLIKLNKKHSFLLPAGIGGVMV